MQEPSVGRIVHYYDQHGEGPYAAIVTGVHSTENVALCVFPSCKPLVNVLYDAEPVLGAQRWCWPPRV